MLGKARSKRSMTTATFAGALVFATLLGAGVGAADPAKPDAKAASKTGAKAPPAKTFTVTVKTKLHEIFRVTFDQPKLSAIDPLPSDGREIRDISEGTEIKWKAEPLFLARSRVMHCKGNLKVDGAHNTIELIASMCDKHEIQHLRTEVENTQTGISVEVKFRSGEYSSNPHATVGHPVSFDYLPDLDGKAKLTVTAICSDANGGAAKGSDSHEYDTAHAVARIYVREKCKLSLE
jgi:hypothetical protein